MALYRIGYPYAHSSVEVNKSAVLLKSTAVLGFQTVIAYGKTYTIDEDDPGPSILNKYKKNGLKGFLLESQGGKSICRGTRVKGLGESMQLALSLAVTSDTDQNDDEKPILLFSAKVDLMPGLEPFLDAKIIPYCNEKDVLPSLKQKYVVAKMVNAKALVLCKRDAKILAKDMQEKYFNLSAITQIDSSIMTPLIIGVDTKELPDLAKVIGNNPFYYKKARKTLLLLVLFLVALFNLYFVLNPIFLASQPHISLKYKHNANDFEETWKEPTNKTVLHFLDDYKLEVHNPQKQYLMIFKVSKAFLEKDSDLYVESLFPHKEVLFRNPISAGDHVFPSEKKSTYTLRQGRDFVAFYLLYQKTPFSKPISHYAKLILNPENSHQNLKILHYSKTHMKRE